MKSNGESDEPVRHHAYIACQCGRVIEVLAVEDKNGVKFVSASTVSTEDLMGEA